MVSATLLASAWILARDPGGAYPLGLEPVFPALGAAALVWAADRAGAGHR